MKPKLVVLLVVLLLLAMIPAMAMAGQAKPEKTVSVVLDARQPIGPQLDAQLGVTSRGPRTGNARIVPVSRGPAAQGIQPRAVLTLINESFEGPTYAPWYFGEFGLSPVGWDSTDYMSKRGQRSFWSAAFGTDPYVYPYYDDDMESWAWLDLDLTGATRLQIRFQYLSDTELGYDGFFWCVTPDEITYYCQMHTGSTNDKWRLVKLDSKGDPVMASLLGSPDAEFAFIFYSDYIFVDRGTFVDALRIRATGPNP